MNHPFNFLPNFELYPSFWIFPIQIATSPQLMYFPGSQTPCYFTENQSEKQHTITQENQENELKLDTLPLKNQESSFCLIGTNSKKNVYGAKVKKQKKGRNILSNIFKSYLQFISSKQFYEKQFPKLRIQLSREQFEEKLDEDIRNFKNYIKKVQIFAFLHKTTQKNTNQQQQYYKIIRTSLLLYLRNFHTIAIYNSRKINPSFRKIHLKQLHEFERSIKQFYRHSYNASV